MGSFWREDSVESLSDDQFKVVFSISNGEQPVDTAVLVVLINLGVIEGDQLNGYQIRNPYKRNIESLRQKGLWQ